MKLIFAILSIALNCAANAGAVVCYDKITKEYCSILPCSDRCEPGLPNGDDGPVFLGLKDQSWIGIFRNFSDAKYDERGRFVGSEKKLAQMFACTFQTRKELKRYLDDNFAERGQGQFGGYSVSWQTVIPIERESGLGHQSLSYGALINLIENPSRVGHNPCWITNDPFYLSRDSSEELIHEALLCQTTRENILIRISKTTEENLFRRVYISKETGQIYPSTKEWLKKCQDIRRT